MATSLMQSALAQNQPDDDPTATPLSATAGTDAGVPSANSAPISTPALAGAPSPNYSALAAPAPAPTPAPSVGFTPQAFDESKGVEGRVASITRSGSPLMDAARAAADAQSETRGLTNSTLGIQASQKAVLDTALPIAQSDAGLFQQQALQNQNLGQSTQLANAQLNQQQQSINAQREQFAQSLGVSVADLQTRRDSLTQQQQQFLANLDLQQTQLAQQDRQFKQNQQTQVLLGQMDINSKASLEQMDAKYKSDIQNNTNISNAWGSMLAQIGTIQNNSALDPAAKTTLVQNTLNAFASFASFWKNATGTAGVQDLLNFSVAGATAGGGGAQGPGITIPPGTRTTQPVGGGGQLNDGSNGAQS